jgi:membrane fusion protein, heavy metal efflux system
MIGQAIANIRRFMTDPNLARARIAAAVIIVIAVVGLIATRMFSGPGQEKNTGSPTARSVAPVLELTEKQLNLMSVIPVGRHLFPVEREAVGSIDFNENLSVQVFTPYQGKIIAAFAQVGDEVKKGQPLFTIDSPDLVQAESTLISTSATFDQANRALLRAQQLYDTQGTGGISQATLEQAVSAKLAAEGAVKAARDAVRVFGKSDSEINTVVAQRKIDPALVVHSPITGTITARNAQPGLLEQPGNAPAPYSIADISTMWLLANVPEIDSSSIKVGQEVKVAIMAHPGQPYRGKITTVGATVDPLLHTLLVRSEVQNPRHDLRSGMFADFIISTGEPINATAVPLDSVVREGDGTMTVWVTTDRRHFAQRQVRLGLQRDGYDQILDGLKPGELVVAKGAVFLDNMLAAPPTD